MRHLDKNDILTDAQHGFRKRRSCETQLLLSSNDFLKSLDSNTQTDAILLDFAKAFDKVAHQRDRTIVLEGSWSDTKPVTSGVPQGNVLGPLLFLVYINDLPQCVTSSHTRLFADDCLIYKEIRSQADADELQVDLDALQEWEQQWMMSFHPQKCQLLRITRKKSPVKASYVIHGHTLAETDTAKYLGVSLHKHSSWSPHVNATITGQLVALVISSPRTAGQLVAKSKIKLVNSSPNVVA